MKIRYGIIGAGNIARKFTDGVKHSSNATIEVVASRTLEKAEKFAKEHGVPCAMGSYEELLASDKIDAVYISVTNNAHKEWVEKAILAGKPVICEKPMMMTQADMMEVEKLAKEKDVLLMEAMWTRFLPTVLKTKEWIAQGRIGKVTSMDVDFSFKMMKFNPQGRLLNKDMYGGGMYDVGVYAIEFAMDMAEGKAKTIKALANICETGVDTEGLAIVRFDTDILARLSFGIGVRRPNDAVIYGQDGSIVLKSFFNCHEVSIYDKAGELVETFTDEVENGFVYEVEHFAELVKAGKKESDRMPLSESMECTRIFDELQAQWAE